MIADAQPVPDVSAVAINKRGPPVQNVSDYKGNQVLRQVTWAVVVRAIAGRYLESVCTVIGAHEVV